MNTEHKYKDKDEYRDNDKDKDAKRISESLSVLYFWNPDDSSHIAAVASIVVFFH